MALLIALSSDCDPNGADLLRRFDDVTVAVNAPQSVLVTESEAMPVAVEVLDGSEVKRRLDRPLAGKPLFLIITAVLDDETAARLEDAGIGYFDATGRRWLRNWERTRRVRRPRGSGRRALYPASIRLAQSLADHPDEPWTQRGLAERSDTTQVTAQRLLARLESEGLVERRGKGPASARWVRDALDLRSWLAREGRPRRVARLSCFVRDPQALPPVAGRRLALTGAAAAAEIGFNVRTGEAPPLLRVDATAEELEGIPEALGGFRTESGANLVLIADPERLAFVDPIESGGRLIAPPSRIMLDLFLEARGEAAAAVFLDLWGRGEVRS